MSRRDLLVLSAVDVHRALPMREAIAVMKQVFAELSAGAAQMPARTHLPVPAHDGVSLIMPAHLPGLERLGVKVVNLFGGNPARGLPRINALVALFDATTGVPLAVLDGASLTALRTGAASGAATDLLARPDAATVAVLGAGVQARTQLEAVCCVRPIRQAWAYDPAPAAAQRFAADMAAALGIPVQVAASAREALAEAAIVCTATTASTPVFADGDLRPGAHINAVGSYQPHVQEIPTATVCRAKVVVDHRASALAETGDLLIPIAQGRFHADHIHAELGEIVAGLRPGRAHAQEITLFKSVGVAVQDVVAAARAVENASAQGWGVAAPLD